MVNIMVKPLSWKPHCAFERFVLATLLQDFYQHPRPGVSLRDKNTNWFHRRNLLKSICSFEKISYISHFIDFLYLQYNKTKYWRFIYIYIFTYPYDIAHYNYKNISIIIIYIYIYWLVVWNIFYFSIYGEI